MSAFYSYEVDVPRNLLRVRMGGLFGPDDIRGFIEARQAAHAQLRCAPNAHLAINDMTAMKIQPQESVAAFQQILSDVAFQTPKLAFVVGKTLARTQLLRALCGRGAACFSTVADAESWLFDAPPTRRIAQPDATAHSGF